LHDDGSKETKETRLLLNNSFESIDIDIAEKASPYSRKQNVRITCIIRDWNCPFRWRKKSKSDTTDYANCASQKWTATDSKFRLTWLFLQYLTSPLMDLMPPTFGPPAFRCTDLLELVLGLCSFLADAAMAMLDGDEGEAFRLVRLKRNMKDVVTFTWSLGLSPDHKE
jgi:hypothetical protein